MFNGLLKSIAKKNLLQVKKELAGDKNNWMLNSASQLSFEERTYYSPLTLACEKGDVRIVKFLLEKKAKVNGVDREDFTPLYGACVAGSMEIVELLLLKKAKVNRFNKSGMTAAYGAVKSDNLQLLKFLESKGADLSIEAAHSDLVSYASASKKGNKCLEYLMKEGKGASSVGVYKLCFQYVNSEDEKERESIIETLKSLIEGGADVNLLSDKQYHGTALHLSCKCNEYELIKLLLENGAEPNSKTEKDDTPLMSMFFLQRDKNAKKNTRKVVSMAALELMFQYKADPNAANKSGTTPFLYLMASHIFSTQKDDVELIKLFLDNGADVNSVDFAKNTPLHLAAKIAFPEACKLLVEYKADVNAKNNNEETPFFSAARYEHSSDKSKEIWNLLLENGAKIEKNEDGDYPHFVASQRNKGHLFMIMLKQKISMKELDHDGNTFVHLIAKDYQKGTKNSPAYLKQLRNILQGTAATKYDVNHKNDDGLNFYDILFPKLEEDEKGEMLKLLQDNGYEIVLNER